MNRIAAVRVLCVVSIGVGCRAEEQNELPDVRTGAMPSLTEVASATTSSSAGSVPRASSAEPAATPPPKLGFNGVDDGVRALSVKDQQQYLVRLVSDTMGLDSTRVAKLRAIVEGSDWLSFGNPKVSKPPMSKAECRARRQGGEWHSADSSCGAPNMVVIETKDGKPTTCIDQYEFPNVACEYPVVWVRASEAAALCEAVGKRLCDAHEWEGACAGDVLPVEQDYPWDHMPKSISHSPPRDKRLWLEYEHNRTRAERWAYGDHVQHELCATGAVKEPRCNVIDFGTCSTSTYPAGSFPKCVSPFGVYDQHGNAAEHMNLALTPEELTSDGGSGWTEMKGSWFIFSNQQTHPDDCRWRAKSWHTTRLTTWNSHRNYHLGFRCCADLPE